MEASITRKRIEELNKTWNAELENEGIEDYMSYLPFSKQYWAEKIKICVCNLETYGYQDCGPTVVHIERYKDWIVRKNRTCTNTAVFINGLLSSLNGTALGTKELQKTYRNVEILIESMNKITYMNYRKATNSKPNANYNSISYEVSKYAQFYRDFFNLIEPNIIIIGGQAGVTYFNRLGLTDEKLTYGGFVKTNNTYVFSVAHFSRTSYTYMQEEIQNIVEKIK
jgi:hypothetical protein